MKDVHKGNPISEFVGEWKMHAILSNDGKKSNVPKGVNIAIDIDEYKNILFNKKIIRHKMRRTQSKKHKIGTMKSTKYHYRVLMIKDLF